MENSYSIGEVKKSGYAYLYDRVIWYGDHQPQRFGTQGRTQGRCVGPSNWQPWPTEDFLDVNKRRATMGINTIEENKAIRDKVCH